MAPSYQVAPIQAEATRAKQLARYHGAISKHRQREVSVLPLLETVFIVALAVTSPEGGEAPEPLPNPSAPPVSVAPVNRAPASYGEAYALAITGVVAADVIGWGAIWLSDVTGGTSMELAIIGAGVTTLGPGAAASGLADQALQHRSRGWAWPVHVANALACLTAVGVSSPDGSLNARTLLTIAAFQVLVVPPVALLWSATSAAAPPGNPISEPADAGRNPQLAAIPVRDPSAPPWRR